MPYLPPELPAPPEQSAPTPEQQAEWLVPMIPAGHAAGIIAELSPDGSTVTVNFGQGFARFRSESFPGVTAGDVVSVGPAVSRWTVSLTGMSTHA